MVSQYASIQKTNMLNLLTIRRHFIENTVITLADWYHYAGLTIPFPPYVDLMVPMASCLRLMSVWLVKPIPL